MCHQAIDCPLVSSSQQPNQTHREVAPDVEHSSPTPRLTWVVNSCRLLEATLAEFARTRPFENIVSVVDVDPVATLEARCLDTIATRHLGPDACVVPVPPEFDAEKARSYLVLTRSDRPQEASK